MKNTDHLNNYQTYDFITINQALNSMHGAMTTVKLALIFIEATKTPTILVYFLFLASLVLKFPA
ncbi:hypothetical protein [Cognaticolwellia aestuarii]|uniref:hypothetical protein n=1 Tax=Cognaticolwellia aestuarii TaxID=329993 RepID=UPI0009873D09|nr:hypothetical protein [Cognaticolwellia aestuarii]